MKLRCSLVLTCILLFARISVADDVRFIIPASSVEAAAKTLLDARAAAFYSLSSGFGVQNFNVKLIYSSQYPLSFQFLPNSRFRLTCGFTARANINYVAGNFDINGEGPVTLEGDLLYEGGTAQITLVGRATAVVNIQGAPGFLLSMIGLGEFTIRLPDFRLGAYALILPSISSTFFVSTSPSVTIVNNTLQLGLQSRAPIALEVDQKRESGDRLNGTHIAFWTGQGFDSVAVPHVFTFPHWSSQTLRGLQGLVQGPTEKYNRWNSLPDVRNHQSFLMDGSLTQLTSNFKQAQPTTTIKTDLIEAPGTTGGNIQFRDPWYIDSLDAVHGSNLMNRGMQNAVYRSRPSPFNPDYDTEPTPGEHPYRGVFLNQGSDWQPPYYSVGAPSPQNFTIGGTNYTAYFQGWTGNGDSIGYQNPAAQQTGVVFKQANAVATAKYKAHRVSSTAAALANNGQRKVVQDYSENYHMVYESAHQIWYTKSTDGGITWLPEKRISEDNPIGDNRLPSITVVEDPHVLYVIWECFVASEDYTEILVKTINPVNGAISEYVLAEAVDNPLGISTLPAIAAQGRVEQYILAVWYNPSMGLVGVCRPSTGGWGNMATLRQGVISSLSLAPIMPEPLDYWTLSWIQGNTVYYSNVHVVGSQPQLGTVEVVSPTGGPTRTVSNVSMVQLSDGPGIVWQQSTPVNAVMFRERTSFGVWTPVASFVHCDHAASAPVVGVFQGPLPGYCVDILWQCGDHVARVSRRGATSLWTPIVNLGQGITPSISATRFDWISEVPTLAVRATQSGGMYTLGLSVLPVPQFEAWQKGWNIAGIAVRVPSYTLSYVFPQRDPSSTVFKYVNGQYVTATEPLDSNTGFWVKYPSSQESWPITYNGTQIDSMAMPVWGTWNMIGSISVPVDTATVTSTPSGIRSSSFFKYLNGGYVIADRLNPGLGYWVKASQQGYLHLKNGAACPVVPPPPPPKDKFIITDSDGNQQELYVVNSEVTAGAGSVEMPPAPPDAEFDVRWESNDYEIAVDPSGGPVDLPIALNEASFPITLEWELDPENQLEYTFIPSGGAGKGVTKVTESGRLNIASATTRLSLSAHRSGSAPPTPMPTVYALGRNHPNPFNPSTRFTFDLPEPGNVTLRIYDILGREVATLVDGFHEAGYHSATWNAAEPASGVYFARFTATDASGVVRLNKVSKLVLAK